MDSIFKICKNGVCGITITGLEKDNDEYLNEEDDIVISTRNYTYSQSITLNVIHSIKSSGEETLQEYKLVKHEIDCIDESEVELPIDGLYTITHIILPTKDWLDYVLERDESALTAYNNIYIYNQESDTFSKYIDGELLDVTVEEILEVNAIPPTDILEKTNTVIRSDKNTFCTCRLLECFNRLCKNILSNLPGKCYNKLDSIKMLIYNRDILWMAINMIKYSIELNQLYEAQRILENVIQCGGICDNITNPTKSVNCGCTN